MGQVPGGQRQPYGRPSGVDDSLRALDDSPRALEAWLTQVWRLCGAEIDGLTDADLMARYVIPWHAKLETPNAGPSAIEWATGYLVETEGMTEVEAKAELRQRRERLLGKKPKKANDGG